MKLKTKITIEVYNERSQYDKPLVFSTESSFDTPTDSFEDEVERAQRLQLKEAKRTVLRLERADKEEQE